MILLLLLTLVQQGQVAWQNRDKPGQTEQAIHLWEKALKENPNQPTLYIDLAKAAGRAVRHAATPLEKKHWADTARDFAAEAIRKNPRSSEAYAAYGEALGQWADAHKGIHSLKAVNRAVDALQKAVALNPKNGYAHMLLSSFYRESPGFLSVGDKAKALEEAKLAVQYGPGYAINHLVLARAYLVNKNKEDAIKELQTILSLTPPPDAAPETHADQQTASDLLKSLGVYTPSCGESTAGYCTQ